MDEQPSNSLMKVPIDVDKGGFNIRGTKIVVMPEHVKETRGHTKSSVLSQRITILLTLDMK
jgi:hypothetical protein